MILEKIKNMFFVGHIQSWYGRFERPISSLSLIGGFVFDALTLKRVDTLWENFWVVIHILIVAVFMILIHVKENEDGDEKNPHKAHFWYVNILQFFFGGLLSTYLVFYFRSADLLVTWPFIFILAGAFIANESLKRHFMRVGFQISLFFLCIYSFAIFMVPVLVHRIGIWVFLLSGFVSLILISFFIFLLTRLAKEKFEESRKMIFLSIGIVLFGVNILYFTHLIPPIPLSLKDAGIYHSIQRDGTGNYVVGYEDLGWQGYFQLYQNFKEIPGETVYAYSAIFSPSSLNIRIIHEWQRFDAISNTWITENIITLPVLGGREGGFRTYSTNKDLSPGKWRVNVKTSSDQLIGRLRFTILSVDIPPPLRSEVKS